jgi:hypothetical protein
LDRVSLIDLALMIDAFGEAAEVPSPLPRHFREEVELGPDLWIDPLRDVRTELLEACDPRGINWDPPTKAYGANYAIVRRNAPDPYFNFDPDRRLWTCIQLSRLVRPTSISMGKGGRLSLKPDGTIERFAPSPVEGCAGRCWVATPEANWLRDEDIPPIRELIATFDADKLPERVLQALWQHEFVHQVFYADIRWPLAATGLESLMHTDRHGSTRQFVQRILGVQATLGLSLADEDTLVRLYDKRSSIAHGKRLGDLDERIRADYMILEELLRTVIRSAILKDDFAALFSDAENIKRQWPV